MTAKSEETPRARRTLAAALALLVTGTFLVSSRMDPPPNDEHAAIVSVLENSRRMADAHRVTEACAGQRAGSCGCRQEAAHRALDRGLAVEARDVLSNDPRCSAEPRSRGQLAEALARSGGYDEAIAAARALPDDPFATYALAQAHHERREIQQAEQQARRAALQGRGAPAHLLLARIALLLNDLDGARRELELMLGENAEDIEALHLLAVVAQRQRRDYEAKQGYLRVLQLDPRHLDARAALVRLAHAGGDLALARAELGRFEVLAPEGDPRLLQLSRSVNAPR